MWLEFISSCLQISSHISLLQTVFSRIMFAGSPLPGWASSLNSVRSLAVLGSCFLLWLNGFIFILWLKYEERYSFIRSKWRGCSHYKSLFHNGEYIDPSYCSLLNTGITSITRPWSGWGLTWQWVCAAWFSHDENIMKIPEIVFVSLPEQSCTVWASEIVWIWFFFCKGCYNEVRITSSDTSLYYTGR